MRRDLAAAGLVGLALLAIVPAYDRVFTTVTWRGPAITAALVALLLAAVVRRLPRGGAWLAAAVSATALVSMLPWLLGVAARPLLPSVEVIGTLRDIAGQGRVELAETPAPTLPLLGLMFLVVGGWWVVAHVAHELAVRWRRSGGALIALTVLWAAPLTVPMEPGRTWPETLPFLAAAGLLLLVVSEDRSETDAEPAPRVPAVGAALGALAITVAAVAPGLLPGYTADAWVGLGSSTAPRGYQPIVDVSERLRQPEERDVLRVLASQRTYLRLAGLSSFDGSTWRLGPAGDGSYRPDDLSLFDATQILPSEQPALVTEPVQVEIEVLDLKNIFVPVPYQPVEVLGPQRDEMVWSTEGGFLATVDASVEGAGQLRAGVREGLSYRVLAARPTPAFADLQAVEYDDATIETWTQLPRAYPELGEQARAVYAAAGATTTVERAFALQDWFASEFTYDLDVPALRGEDALEEFVLEDRVGYCEYFATAMAVMLRETGIPARVATGFLPGRVTEPADPANGRELTQYTVSTADAHAWVEVLFPDYGWITFEPTPRDDRTQVVPTADDLTPIENVRERDAREARERAESPDAPVEDTATPDSDDTSPPFPDEGDQGGAAAGDGRDGASDETPWLTVLGLVVALGLVGAALLLTRTRARRSGTAAPGERILTAQRDLLATAARHGMRRRPEETTKEVMARWRDEARIDDRGESFARIAQAAAFGGAVDAGDAAEAERTGTELAALLRDSVERSDRWLAPVRIPAERVGDRLGRAGTAVMDRVRNR